MSLPQEDLVGVDARVDHDAASAPSADDPDTLDTADAQDTEITDAVIGELPPPSPEDIDLSLEDIVARSQRADAHLQRWRTTSVDRNAAWQVDEALREEERSRVKGWFLLGGAGGITLALLALAAGLALTQPAPVAAPVAAVAPARKAPVEAVAAPVTPVAAPVATAVAPPVAPPVADVADASEPPQAPPAPPPAALAMPHAKVWTAGSYLWAEAVVAHAGVELAWFDAAGQEVLDRVPCTGKVADGWLCKSGRSSKRTSWALSQGAAPGDWTVKACDGSGCTALGSARVD